MHLFNFCLEMKKKEKKIATIQENCHQRRSPRVRIRRGRSEQCKISMRKKAYPMKRYMKTTKSSRI